MTAESVKSPHELVNRPMKVYLAGSIQASPDGGVDWRRWLTPILMKMGFEVLDPTIYESKELGDPPSVKGMISKCIEDEDWERFDHLVDLLQDRDVRLVHEADFVLALIDPTKYSAGTTSEVWEAVRHANIPVYAFSNEPKSRWSYWELRTVRRHGKVFHDWTDILRFLHQTYGTPEPDMGEKK